MDLDGMTCLANASLHAHSYIDTKHTSCWRNIQAALSQPRLTLWTTSLPFFRIVGEAQTTFILPVWDDFFDMNRCTIKIPLNTICLGNARIVSLWASACQLRPFISIDPYWPIRWYFPCLTKKLESVKPWFDVRSVHSKCHTSVFVSSIMMNLCDCLFLKRGLQNWGLAILVPPPNIYSLFSTAPNCAQSCRFMIHQGISLRQHASLTWLQLFA